jgi:phage anti-repressor protein
MRKLTKKELLKVFTKIPNEFIDDFYDTFVSKHADHFSINLDTISKWLQSRKDELFRTLKRSYIQNIDYNVTQTRSKNGGNHYKLVMLTIDCFKRLCMRSHSKKAEEVRTYFIELDDFITHYSDQISDGIVRDIEKVARKIRKNPRADGPGYVYAIRASNKIIKFGETKDLIARLRAYNTGRVDDVQLLYAFKTNDRRRVEACVKGLIESKRYKKKKELYEIDINILKKIVQGCDNLSMEMKEVNSTGTIDGKYYVMFMKSGGGELYESL